MTHEPLEQVSSNQAFGGNLVKYKYKSAALGGLIATFNIFLPASVKHGKVPVLVYLAGLTCTEDTGAHKGGFLRDAADHGIAILFPDTSPRGANIEGEDDDWDFGTGAGFYLNATHPKYSMHYNMYTHITLELPQVIEAAGIPIDLSRQSIFGHSMGGHGALTLYLSSKTKQYRSASAFAPISNPSQAPWGLKIFTGYLQGGVEEGKVLYDATYLVSKTSAKLNILVDYGSADQFLEQKQLLPDKFLEAARNSGHGDDEVNIRCQEGYDHSYYFISTFAKDHIDYHARFLNT